jgi:type I restriction enzyme S subunit
MYDSLVGKVILINKQHSGSLLNQNAVLIRAKNKSNSIQNLLLNNFRTKRYLNYIEEIYRGNANQASITLEDLFKFQIPIPPTFTEQKAIATALSDVDELINSLEKLIAKKKAIKQGAMQELLTPPNKGGKRLAGFSGEWEARIIGEIGNTYGGLSGKSKKDFDKGKYPYITFMNVMYNTVIDTSIFENVNIKSGEQQNKARKGDLFFNTSSETPEEVGMCALLNKDVRNLYLNSFCFGFRLRENLEIDGLLFSYLMNSEVGRKLFLSLAQGATRYNLSKSNFNKLIIVIPEIKEQEAIVKILSDMDLEIESLEAKKKKYKSIKEGMMQELLTGKIRLV